MEKSYPSCVHVGGMFYSSLILFWPLLLAYRTYYTCSSKRYEWCVKHWMEGNGIGAKICYYHRPSAQVLTLKIFKPLIMLRSRNSTFLSCQVLTCPWRMEDMVVWNSTLNCTWRPNCNTDWHTKLQSLKEDVIIITSASPGQIPASALQLCGFFVLCFHSKF